MDDIFTLSIGLAHYPQPSQTHKRTDVTVRLEYRACQHPALTAQSLDPSNTQLLVDTFISSLTKIGPVLGFAIIPNNTQRTRPAISVVPHPSA